MALRLFRSDKRGDRVTGLVRVRDTVPIKGSVNSNSITNSNVRLNL